MALEALRDPIKEDLLLIDTHIIHSLQSNIPMIKEIVEYALTCGGKRIRPMVLLYSTHALGYQGTQHIPLAAVIELVHTATLLHDDVVDHADERRHHQTANIIWGNEASVLVGDFLYSRAFEMMVEHASTEIVALFARTTHLIAEGEIMQLARARHAIADETFYLDIIDRKTAKLFELAAEVGARIATPDETAIEAMRRFGHHLGLAYQLIDDALDYAPSNHQTGKQIGQDISEGKVTLPLIHTMRHVKPTELAQIHDAIATGNQAHIPDILKMIELHQAIQYTADAAREQAFLAQSALAHIPDSIYRTGLLHLCDFVIERTY